MGLQSEYLPATMPSWRRMRHCVQETQKHAQQQSSHPWQLASGMPSRLRMAMRTWLQRGRIRLGL